MDFFENTIPADSDNPPAENPAPIISPKVPFIPDKTDFFFALAAFILGYLFSRWVFFQWNGWGTAVFTALYLLYASVFLAVKNTFRHPAAWFWLAVTLLTGLSCAFWDNMGLRPVLSLFLFCSAVYFIPVAAGHTLTGISGNFLLLDALNAVILIPFRNFMNQYVSFKILIKDDGTDEEKKPRTKKLPVFLGLLLAALMIVWLIPSLMSADSGGFTRMVHALAGLFENVNVNMPELLLYIVLAIPIAAYMYGLISGAAHGRNTDTIRCENAKKTVAALRIAQPVTVYIALGAVCGLYIIFIAAQVPYFFSAFAGTRPEGYMVYSEYARQGFFELCRIAAINLALITAGNVVCTKKRSESRSLTVLNLALSLITLLLIATAFSKMALYIGVYGLSVPRLLTCVFMVFLAAVFTALLVLQKREFSIVRFALVIGALMLCVLCLINPDAAVVRYNAARYLSGTLTDFDTDILYRAGAAGVLPALEVYERTGNEGLKKGLELYLQSQKLSIGYRLDGLEHTLSCEAFTALERLREAKIPVR